MLFLLIMYSLDASYFLAQAIGIIFSIAAISIFVCPDTYKKIVSEFSKNTETAVLFRFLAGFLALMIGTLMVLFHNVWTSDWRVAITIVGWMALIKGVFYLLFPEVINKTAVMFGSTIFLRMASVIMFCVGVFFWYAGFFL